MNSKHGLWAVAVVGLITLIIYIPVINGLKDAVIGPGGGLTLEYMAEIISKPNIERSLYFTLVQAAISTILSVIIGGALAVILVFTRIPGERLFHIIGFMAFMAPPMIVVTGFLDLYGEYGVLSSVFPPLSALGSGFTGIVSAHVFYNIPLAFSFMYSSLVGIPRNIIQTILLYSKGKTSYTIRKVIIPYITPSAIASALIIFIYCFTSFAIPLSIGGIRYSTLEVYIYRYYKISLNAQAAASIALIQFVILQLAVSALIVMYRREKLSVAPLSPYRYWHRTSAGLRMAGLIFAYLVLLYLTLPLIVIPLHSLINPYTHAADTSSWLRILNPGYDPGLGVLMGQVYINTFYYALMTLIIGVSAGLLIALETPGFTDILYISLIAISPLTLSLGLLRTYGSIIPTPMIIVLAHVIASLPLATRLLRLGYYRIPRAIIDAARSLGERGIPFFFRVLAPLMKPSLLTAMLLAVVVSLGEFSATYFIATTQYYTISPTIHVLRGIRKWQEADALATLLLILTGTITASIRGKMESWRM